MESSYDNARDYKKILKSHFNLQAFWTLTGVLNRICQAMASDEKRYALLPSCSNLQTGDKGGSVKKENKVIYETSHSQP